MKKLTEEEIVKEAHERFAELEELEKDNRKAWIDDLKMAYGDSDNKWQWETNDVSARRGKTTVTVNKVRQHNRQITNDARQNQVTIKIKPDGNGAHKKTAEIIQGLIKNILKVSKAETAFDIGFDFAVDAGLGYWDVTTDYIDNESMQQEILIKPVNNPLNVYMCPGEAFDGSDCPFAFEFEDMRKEVFKAKFPEAEETNIGWNTIESEWIKKDKIRVAKYWKVIESKDRLYYNEQGEAIKLSSIDDPEQKKLLKASGLKSRQIVNKKVICYLIAGDKVLDTYEWLGTNIPVVPCKGEEKVIDGEVYRAGNTRLLKDSQRMYNYELSCEIEYKKLQGKTPWVGPIEAFKGVEDIWASANDTNYAYLPYNHKDDAGDPINAPQRVQPPVSSQAYLDGMRIHSDNMQAVSGQFDAQMGQNVNQQSGKALLAVQSRGLVSTFNFIDNKARALKRTGEIILELIKIYDVEQIKRIIGEDEKERDVTINPEQPEAYAEYQQEDGSIKEIFNPNVGRYIVDVQVGADYGTKRQEAFNALTEVARTDPSFMQMAGDIYWEIADLPMSEKVAERYSKLPQIQALLDDKENKKPEIPQEVQQKMQDAELIIQKMDETIQEMQKKLDDKLLEIGKLEIDRARAETDVLKTIAQYLPPDAVGTIGMHIMTSLKEDEMETGPTLGPPTQNPQQLAPQPLEPAQQPGTMMTNDQIQPQQPGV